MLRRYIEWESNFCLVYLCWLAQLIAKAFLEWGRGAQLLLLLLIANKPDICVHTYMHNSYVRAYAIQIHES